MHRYTRNAASHASGARFAWRTARVVLIALAVPVLVWMALRWSVVGGLQEAVQAFGFETLGLPMHSAKAASWIAGLGAAFVSIRTLLLMAAGRLTRLWGFAGAGIVAGFWGLVQFAQAPLAADGRSLQRYAVIDGRCQFFDLERTVDAKTGATLRPVTPEALARCRLLEQGEAPRRLPVVQVDRVVWFDPLTGEPRVHFARHDDGSLVFFDRAGHDPTTGQPLRPVTATVVEQVRRQLAGAAAPNAAASAQALPQAAPAQPPAQSPAALPAAPERSVTVSLRTAEHSHQPLAAAPAAALQPPGAVARPHVAPPHPLPTPAARFSTEGHARRGWQWVAADPAGPQPANPLAALGLQRAGDERLRLPGPAPAAAGMVDPQALDAARQAGFGRLAVLRTLRSVQVEPSLSGFTSVRIRWWLEEFDTRTGAVVTSRDGERLGRGFSEAQADLQAWQSRATGP